MRVRQHLAVVASRPVENTLAKLVEIDKGQGGLTERTPSPRAEDPLSDINLAYNRAVASTAEYSLWGRRLDDLS